jgi:hypothetical protein
VAEAGPAPKPTATSAAAAIFKLRIILVSRLVVVGLLARRAKDAMEPSGHGTAATLIAEPEPRPQV